MTGALVRLLRTRAGLTQEELAVRADLGVRTVRNLESGRGRPRGQSLRLIAGALGVTTKDLVGAVAEAPSRMGCRLPPDDTDFTGQAAAAVRLIVLLSPPGGVPTGVPVAIVTGGPGVGKTALAVHVAHALLDRFPDGVLYLGLGGEHPLNPAEALGRFLRALGVGGWDHASTLDDRAAAFRARLTDRRVLVVLDDATTEAQVRPLLPGTPGNAVLVISRSPLAGLLGAGSVALDGLGSERSVRWHDT